MDDMQVSPLIVAMETWFQGKLGGMHTSIPGIVESYDGHDKRTATILPAINFKVPRGPVLKYRPIPNVPIMFPSAGGFQMVFPIKPGDGVLLVFSEASMGNWMNGAGQVDPEDSTRFSMHDAIAIPGLWSSSKVPNLPSDGDFLLVSTTGARVGGTDGGLLDLSNDASDLRTEIEKIWDAVAAIRTDVASSFTNLGAVTTSPAALIPVGPVTPLTTALTAEATIHTAAGTAIAADKAELGGLLK